jgi:hypothetical protein
MDEYEPDLTSDQWLTLIVVVALVAGVGASLPDAQRASFRYHCFAIFYGILGGRLGGASRRFRTTFATISNQAVLRAARLFGLPIGKLKTLEALCDVTLSTNSIVSENVRSAR